MIVLGVAYRKLFIFYSSTFAATIISAEISRTLLCCPVSSTAVVATPAAYVRTRAALTYTSATDLLSDYALRIRARLRPPC
jgi:hypothetical protein